MINLKKYAFRKYSEKFPLLFRKERAKLRKILPRAEIEHVGSSAVKGLGGKGIIDISVLTPRKKVKRYIAKLEKEGFEYKPQPGDKHRKFLQKIIIYGGKEKRVHVHLTINKDFWHSYIAFRDYLAANKEARDEYARIKREAAKHAKGEGKKYGAYKMNFIKEHVRKAIKIEGGNYKRGKG